MLKTCMWTWLASWVKSINLADIDIVQNNSYQSHQGQGTRTRHNTTHLRYCIDLSRSACGGLKYQFGLLKFGVGLSKHNGFLRCDTLIKLDYLAICTSASTFVFTLIWIVLNITFSFPILKFIFVRLSQNPQSTIEWFGSINLFFFYFYLWRRFIGGKILGFIQLGYQRQRNLWVVLLYF